MLCRLLSECFAIQNFGPYGTINGLRLGTDLPAEASPEASAEVRASATLSDLLTRQEPASVVKSMDLAQFLSDTPSFALSSEQVAEWQRGPVLCCSRQISWFEINAALGHSALLLSTLQRMPASGIVFSKYDIVPMGNVSKIVARQQGPRGQQPQNAVIYPLYSDDRFAFFGKRNFNFGLQGLFQCLFDATSAVARMDRTLTPPHPIEEHGDGSLTIDGLGIAYGTDGDRWTRAMKYFLTDLKYVQTFAVKHVAR